VNRNPFEELIGEQEREIPEEPVEAIPKALKHKPSQAKRNRSWERLQRDRGIVVTYRGIPSELHESVKDLADELWVNVGDVVRAFLEYSLEAYESGDLELEPQFKIGKMTLYPEG
jgi:hypothetical protein